jgi:hypothetical protein
MSEGACICEWTIPETPVQTDLCFVVLGEVRGSGKFLERS